MKRRSGQWSFVPDDRYEVVWGFFDDDGKLEWSRADIVGFSVEMQFVDEDAGHDGHEGRVEAMWMDSTGIVSKVNERFNDLPEEHEVVRRGTDPSPHLLEETRRRSIGSALERWAIAILKRSRDGK